jgi:hypothetical protein
MLDRRPDKRGSRLVSELAKIGQRIWRPLAYEKQEKYETEAPLAKASASSPGPRLRENSRAEHTQFLRFTPVLSIRDWWFRHMVLLRAQTRLQ